MKKVNLVLGTMTFGEQVFSGDVTSMIRKFLDSGYSELDTAYVYNNGESEKLIGASLQEIDASKVIVSTKVNPRITGRLNGKAVSMQLNQSLERLGVSSVGTLYFHFPDPPVDSALEMAAELYMEGKFKELGLSNYPAWMVADVYYKCKEHGWVLPTVYEGLYNPLSRKAENELKQALDFFGIRFYAYNPLAGGLLTDKYSKVSDAPATGRFTYRPNYQKRYWKPSYFKAVDYIKEVSKKNGISIVEAVYRWLAYHSMIKNDSGDAIILGASSLSQLEQNITCVQKGPLPEEVKDAIESAWEISKADAPEYFKIYNAKQER